MIRIWIALLPFVALQGCSNNSPIANDAKAAAPVNNNPTVVELYQSQGCSSCPPAHAALNAVADRSDVIALSFAVTYWDKLGWKDIFGDEAYTQRQYDYAKSLGAPNVYTPQIVLNGVRHFTGIKPGELTREIARNARPSGGPDISSTSGKVYLGAGSGSAKVWLIHYDPRIQNVAVRAGENNGRVLPHKNIVRQITQLGSWSGREVSYNLPAPRASHWRSVVLVQRGDAGRIIAARKL
jgi:hypothetical protein